MREESCFIFRGHGCTARPEAVFMELAQGGREPSPDTWTNLLTAFQFVMNRVCCAPASICCWYKSRWMVRSMTSSLRSATLSFHAWRSLPSSLILASLSMTSAAATRFRCLANNESPDAGNYAVHTSCATNSQWTRCSDVEHTCFEHVLGVTNGVQISFL